MENYIKDTLKKQIQILSERSVRENGEYLAPITEQMIELAKLLDPELRPKQIRYGSYEDYKQLANQIRENW